MIDDAELHIDKIAYAVALLEGAKRIHSSAPGEDISRIGIPFYLLIGFSIENGLKALLQFQGQHQRELQRSHDLADLLAKTGGLRERLWPGAVEDVEHLSRYHREYWFRYPERAATADVFKAESACMMVDHLLVQIAHLIGYRGA
ncbi:hypothetical protein ABIF65_009915 [Bradyrhizobium japonicum]|jgi:hypothetical protein|uniref:hypothetical protein n=1 Tax=Bradyrhizobium TaxID=374 RepID=UPI001BAB5B29|nr:MULTISPECIES: hypothetical protein [Bradyrhizobium]WLC01658.1 hypothetical protein QIH92_21035 [Bradyrhizobium japonicum USDA 123]MBR0884515.1 hypothetical protein [Bradyrhizobium liaoningense]MBR1004799.1 hypothetical protein [Bradyrhizobium liaoningense]MBR1071155.1 hypothetical protein [Bradyrhizobium liaoningense]MCP1742387.1 hypothetical protein [Bradyrhizobium japonicum]